MVKWKHPGYLKPIYYVSDKVFRAIHVEKVKKSMDQIDKTDINDIGIWYVHEKKNQPNFSMSCIYRDCAIFVMQYMFRDILNL